MLISSKRIIVQLVIILLCFFISRLLKKMLRRGRLRHFWWIWTIILWGMAVQNLGIYWSAYPIAAWMILALLLILIQAVHNHEFIYRRYWPVFWRLSSYFAGLVFIASLFSNALPLV